MRLAVYDIRGRKIASLYRGEAEGGTTLGVSWDGRDGGGREAPSGIYFARAEIGGRSITRKLVLLR